MISEKARNLYFHVHQVPGWLLILSRFTGDKEDDLHEYADYIDEIERNYHKNKPDVFAFKQELIGEHTELQPKIAPGSVTDDMIQRARDFPITELIENKRKWALCPFHTDRNPSLFLKNNFFYCFVCGENGDTIKLVQHLYNVDFKTAVKVLQ